MSRPADLGRLAPASLNDQDQAVAADPAGDLAADLHAEFTTAAREEA